MAMSVSGLQLVIGFDPVARWVLPHLARCGVSVPGTRTAGYQESMLLLPVQKLILCVG